jgi:hypothetical protein
MWDRYDLRSDAAVPVLDEDARVRERVDEES